MSQLNKTNFGANYGTTGTQFPDNTTGLITELIMRTFGQDMLDSFLNNVDDLQKMTTVSGTDTYTAPGGIASYANGFMFVGRVLNANTGAATLNVNAKGAISIVKEGSSALAAGDLDAGGVYLFIFDNNGGNKFHVVGLGGGGGGGSVSSVNGDTGVVIVDLQSVLDEGSSASIATEIDVTVTGASDSGFFRLHPTQGHEWYYEDTGTGVATTMALNPSGWNVNNNFLNVGLTVSQTDVTISNGPLILAADPLVALGAATKQYVDAAVVGLWDDRGNFDASVNAYPSSGGSGTAGAILKGDIWTISVAGTLPTGQVVEAGDTVRALVDTPGNTQANWAIAQNNIGYVPLSNTLASANIFVGNGSNVATAVSMSGEATIANTGAVTLTNSAVIGKVLTGYVSGAGTVAATDTILEAIQKLNGNDATKWSLASGGALTANNTLTGAFSVTFNLSSTTSPFNVTGAYTVPAGVAVNAYLSTFAGTLTGKGTSNDVIAGMNVAPTLNNSSGVGITHVGIRLFPVFGGSVTPSASISFLVLAGNAVAGSELIRGANSSGVTRWSLKADGSQVWTTTLTGSDFGGTMATNAANGTGHLLFSFQLAGSATTAHSGFGMKMTGGVSTNATNYTYNSVWDNRSLVVGHTGFIGYGFRYAPVVTGAQAGTETLYAFIAESGLSGFQAASNTPTAVVQIGAVTTARASLRIEAGATTTAPTSPNSGDIWHEGTNNRLMFRQGANSMEVVVSDGTTTAGTTPAGTVRVRINGTNYDLLHV